ncbi:MAG: hypothetical protein LBK68_00150 [Candidatus Margulisbacteria bacterium]|nr:hypothetical protein [Candidatus Margulisiibacteriota bacterium]
MPELLADGRTLVVYDNKKYGVRELTRISQLYPDLKIDPSKLKIVRYHERPRRSREYIPLDNFLNSINVNPEDLLEDRIVVKGLSALVNEALTLLPYRRREILDFSFGLEGHPQIPIAEIAEHLHISIDLAHKELDAARRTVGSIVAYNLNHSENALPNPR